MNLVWFIFVLLLSPAYNGLGAPKPERIVTGSTFKNCPTVAGCLNQAPIRFPACPPPAGDYLSLSNQIASLAEPTRELIKLAYAWWESGEKWGLERLWSRWPDRLLEISDQLPKFFSDDDFNEALSWARMIATSDPLGSGSGPGDVYALIAQKLLPEALERLIQAGLERSHWPLACWLALETGKRSDALKYLLFNETPTAKQRKLMFELALETGNFTEATNQGNLLLKSSRLLGKSVYWLNNMSWAYLGQAENLTNSPDQAIALKLEAAKYIEKALSQDRSGPVLHTAALIQSSLGMYREASMNIQLALALNPTNQAYRALLSEIMKQLKDKTNE